MSICPNKSSIAWINSVNQIGELETLKLWVANNYELPEVDNVTMEELHAVANRLREVIPVDVVINTSMEVSGRVNNTGKEPFVEINPYLLRSDTVIHEFAHLYIDLIGGLDNPQIQAALRQLKGSDLEAILKKTYADVYESDINKFNKELVAQAIGLEGAEIFKSEVKQTAWKSWLSTFFARLKRLIGINESVAKTLAKEIIYNKPQAFTGTVAKGIYEKRIKDEPNSPALTKSKVLLAKAKGVLKGHLATFTKYNYDSKSDAAKQSIARLEALANILDTYTEKHAMLEFVKAAKFQTEGVRARLEKIQAGDSVGLETLNFLKNYGNSFDPELAEGMLKELAANHPDVPKSEYEDVLQAVIYNHNRINKIYVELSRGVLVDQFSNQKNTKSDEWFELQAHNAWVKQIPRGLSKEELKEAKLAFINEYLAEHADEIKAHKQEYFNNFFKVIPKDLKNFYSDLVGLKDLDSAIIQYTIQLIEQTESRIRKDVNVVTKKATKLYDDYIAYFGRHSDQKVQYAPLLAKDANGKILPELTEKLDSKYIGTPVEKLYDFIANISTERDTNLNKAARLGLKLPKMNKTTVERIAENGLIDTLKEEFKDISKARSSDTDLGEQDSTVKDSLNDKLEILVNAAGQEKSTVPVYFRADIEESEQSFDVMTTVLLDFAQSVNFKQKVQLVPVIDAIREQIKEADVIQVGGTADMLKINKNSGQVYTIKGINSNVLKTFDKVIAQRIFGQAFEEGNNMKLVKSLGKYTSYVMLSLNYMSAGANFLQGAAATYIESAGGEFYSSKDVAAAWRKYGKYAGDTIGDIGANKYTSKVNLLMEHYDALMNWNALKSEFANDNRFKRLIKSNPLFALSHTAETTAQQVLMLSVLNNIKVRGKDGKFLTKDGKSTNVREEAMSLDEAWEVGYLGVSGKAENKKISEEEYNKLSEKEKSNYTKGALMLNPLVANTENEDISPEAEESVHNTTQLLNRLNLKLFGNYDPRNKSIVKRTMLGFLVGQMRGFLVQGFRERYKGAKTLYMKDSDKFLKFRTVKREELRFDDMNYNMQVGKFEEGSYISTLRFLSRLVGALKSSKLNIGAAKNEAWEELTDHEKANVKKALTEVALAVLLLGIAVMLSNMADDDDDNTGLITAAFFSRRLYSELFTYLHPKETIRTMRSPAVSLNIVEGTLDVLYQILSPTEVYESGRHKGENKLAIKVIKVTPLKILDRSIKASKEFLEK